MQLFWLRPLRKKKQNKNQNKQTNKKGRKKKKHEALVPQINKIHKKKSSMKNFSVVKRVSHISHNGKKINHSQDDSELLLANFTRSGCCKPYDEAIAKITTAKCLLLVRQY